jgi:hypothetical protein
VDSPKYKLHDLSPGMVTLIDGAVGIVYGVSLINEEYVPYPYWFDAIT